MRQFIRVTMIAAMGFGLSACGGDKQESADKAAEAQKAIQEGMQKEKSMVEGMMKAGENLEKQMTEQKEETKK
jgi:hypothetical protein